MRIMQVITLSELGGAQSVVVNLANELSKEHEVVVVAGEGDGKMWNLLNENIRKIYNKHIRRNISLIDDLLTIFLLFMLYIKYKPNIIHLHSSKIGILGRIVFPSKKIIYTVHGFDSIRLAYRKYLPIERYMQYRCKAIVGVSKYDEINLQKEGITNHVHCIYNGIKKPNTLTYNPFKSFGNYKYIVLCIARLSPPKNSHLFLQIAALLPKYAFIWIGNQNIPKESIPNNVFFMGNLPNAGAYNEYADLFILPSDYEGLPIVIIEAMSFGKPVVASNVGGISEIITDNINGFTIDNKPELFVEKIEYILENKNVYDYLSKNALIRFQQDLTVEKMVKRYENIYCDTQS